MAAETLLADKAFDADERVIEPLLARGKLFVIPPKSNRKVQRDFDKDAYNATSSRISFASSSNTAPSPPATTKLPEISSPQSTSRLLSFGSIDGRP
jgi:hypothetical protein